ncbi:MAG: ABC transporter ATP-binding protein [Gemmatimonadota bacterium]
MTTPVLELRGIAKRFGSVRALHGADFRLAPGEVHALLGENGAGKTTLMQVAFGLVRPDRGEVRVNGVPRVVDSPRTARTLGIGMVHQHFTSVPALTVAENVALGAGHGIGRGLSAPATGTVLARLWTGLDPAAKVETLPVGLRQRLEIVKALAADARILLLDEPTAVLTPPEVDDLLDTIRRFAADGGSVVLISHKLDEVFRVADRVTVLRHGRVTLTAPLPEVTSDQVAEAMLGRVPEAAASDQMAEAMPDRAPEATFADRLPGARPSPPSGEVVRVEAGGLHVAGLQGRGTGLEGADLLVHAGEILGLAAVEGNGHRELLHAVAGLARPLSGTLRVDGPVALVPEDRTTEGLIPELSLAENVTLGLGAEAPWVRRGWIDWPAARVRTRQLLIEFDVRAPGPTAQALVLSGGNQQRLVMARALEGRPKVLVAEGPTRGLDIAATAAVHGHIRRAARDGVAVLLYSADLDEVLALAHRVVVVARGRLVPVAPGMSREAIGRLMLGPGGPGSG